MHNAAANGNFWHLRQYGPFKMANECTATTTLFILQTKGNNSNKQIDLGS